MLTVVCLFGVLLALCGVGILLVAMAERCLLRITVCTLDPIGLCGLVRCLGSLLSMGAVRYTFYPLGQPASRRHPPLSKERCCSFSLTLFEVLLNFINYSSFPESAIIIY